MTRAESEQVSGRTGESAEEWQLVDEVADIREGSVVQVHADEFCADAAVETFFKTLEDESRQVGLGPEHSQERFAIDLAIVVARYATGWANRQ